MEGWLWLLVFGILAFGFGFWALVFWLLFSHARPQGVGGQRDRLGYRGFGNEGGSDTSGATGASPSWFGPAGTGGGADAGYQGA